LPEWIVGIQLSGARIDGERLIRLENVFRSQFSDFDADCALWSGWLAVQGVVQSGTPIEALESALATINSAFDEARLDMDRVSEITDVTMRRARGMSASEEDSLPRALLRLLSPAPRK
jgi:hypothetical protein